MSSPADSPSPTSPHSPRPITVRLERRLGAAQVERRNRLLDAAGSLASEGGYAAVTMRAVADRARIGLATVYRYFSSKDHLIAEVHAVRGARVARELQQSPPTGETAEERVVLVCERLIAIVSQDLNIASAGVMALTSGDPAASSSEQWQTMVVGPCMEAAFGDTDVGNRAEICEIFGHLIFAVMIGLTTGLHDRPSAMAILKSAAKRML
jgi:AcrR family transcriptional regulator